MHDVTRGMDFRMNRQVLIGYRPAVLVTVESFEKIGCRPDSDTYDDHIRFNAFSRFQNYALDRSVAIETLDTRTKDELHAVCFVFLLKECADLVSKSFWNGISSGVTTVTNFPRSPKCRFQISGS
jgi:hypothetical protein